LFYRSGLEKLAALLAEVKQACNLWVSQAQHTRFFHTQYWKADISFFRQSAGCQSKLNPPRIGSHTHCAFNLNAVLKSSVIVNFRLDDKREFMMTARMFCEFFGWATLINY
jgi:hypothetical protein